MRTRRGLAGAIAALGLVAGATATTQAPQGQNYLGLILGEGRYLKGYAGLEQAAPRHPANRDMFDIARSFILGSSADYVPANAASCPDGQVSGALQNARYADALPEIVRRARDARIVILNENHLEPRHRAFGLQVARALRPLGYRSLAIEALTNEPTDEAAARSMAELRRRGHPVRSTGLYTNEPMFAEFVRQALALGYQPFAYDGPGAAGAEDRVAAREDFQARTIHRRVIGANPEGRILVYVGFRHVTEMPFDGGLGRPMAWMAARLKRITGLDPLTIDQREQVNPGCLPGRAIRRARRANRFGTVILRSNGANATTGAYRSAVDLQVFHLPVPPLHRRPAWMTGVGRRPMPIPARLLGHHGRRLVQAFIAGGAPDAVPVDQVLVAPGETRPPPLMVPDGEVILRVQDEDAPD